MTIPDDTKLEDALEMLNQRKAFLVKVWHVEQTQLLCSVTMGKCDDMRAERCFMSSEDYLLGMLTDDVCLVVVSKEKETARVTRKRQSVVSLTLDSDDSSSTEHEHLCMNDPTALEFATGSLDELVDEECTKSAMSAPRPRFEIAQLRSVQENNAVIGKTSNLAEKIPEKKKMRVFSKTVLKRSFTVGSGHFVYHADTDLEWPCTVDCILVECEFNVKVSTEHESEPFKVTMEQLLKEADKRSLAFSEAWSQCELSNDEDSRPAYEDGSWKSLKDCVGRLFQNAAKSKGVKLDNEKQQEAQEMQNMRQQVRGGLRRLSKLVNTNNRLGPSNGSPAGWIQLDARRSQKIYYSLSGESVRQIAHKLKTEPEGLLYHNLQLHKDLVLSYKC